MARQLDGKVCILCLSWDTTYRTSLAELETNNNAHKPVRAEPKEKGVKMKSDTHWQKQMANVLEKWLDRPPTPTWPPGEGITFDVGCAQEEDMGSKQNMSPQACK